mmetsp:Transcript_64312/g.94167  ORF Transcript_64312/g.94167 Transcript_64312/m.94167 type:complete len:208 (+) Transcript_64312:2034-2657(+)
MPRRIPSLRSKPCRRSLKWRQRLRGAPYLSSRSKWRRLPRTLGNGRKSTPPLVLPCQSRCVRCSRNAMPSKPRLSCSCLPKKSSNRLVAKRQRPRTKYSTRELRICSKSATVWTLPRLRSRIRSPSATRIVLASTHSSSKSKRISRRVKSRQRNWPTKWIGSRTWVVRQRRRSAARGSRLISLASSSLILEMKEPSRRRHSTTSCTR